MAVCFNLQTIATCLICSGDSPVTVAKILQDDLHDLSKWIEMSRMKLNLKKSSVMWFSIKPPFGPLPPVLLDATPLTVVDKQKYLGIIFDHRLNWSFHVAKVCKSMSYYLSLISPHVKSLPTAIVKMLMESLVFSRYTYALPVWGPAINRDCLSHLDHLQNRAVRLTCGLRRYDHVSRCKVGLGWLPMSQFIQYRSVLAMLGQHYLGEGVSFSPPIKFGRKHSYRTRCPPWFVDIFRYSKTFSQRFFRHQATTWWNSLPSSLFNDLTFS